MKTKRIRCVVLNEMLQRGKGEKRKNRKQKKRRTKKNTHSWKELRCETQRLRRKGRIG